VVTTLRGDATVARVSLAQPLALRTRDDVLLHDRITTREHSLVHVLLRDRALLTVRELSVLSITEGAARAMVDLRSGKVGLVVARNLMRPGDVVELHTPNVVVAVRGTVFVVEIVPSSSAAVTTRIHLLQGNLDVSLRNDPTAAPVQLNSLQAVEITDNTIGTVRSLSSDAAMAATHGLTVGDLFRPGPPAGFLSALVAQQQAIVGAPGALVRGTIRDTLNRATNAEGRTAGIGLGGSTGAAPTGGPLSGPGPLLPIQLPTELLPGR
jgi:FecR protein